MFDSSRRRVRPQPLRMRESPGGYCNRHVCGRGGVHRDALGSRFGVVSVGIGINFWHLLRHILRRQLALRGGFRSSMAAPQSLGTLQHCIGYHPHGLMVFPVLVCSTHRIVSERFWYFALQVSVIASSPTAINCPEINQAGPVRTGGWHQFLHGGRAAASKLFTTVRGLCTPPAAFPTACTGSPGLCAHNLCSVIGCCWGHSKPLVVAIGGSYRRTSHCRAVSSMVLRSSRAASQQLQIPSTPGLYRPCFFYVQCSP